MAKLYFRYGAMGSAKTLNLLAVAHNYRQQGKKVVLIKPDFDVRFGKGTINSRAGLEKEADILINASTNLHDYDFEGISCILVDEAQFLSRKSIDQLREITLSKGIPVICYGLRSNFVSELFEGSKRLMEISDTIEEVKSTCYFCNKKATMNLKFLNGEPTLQGPTIDIGAEEKYLPACFGCYSSKLKKAEALAANIP